MRYRLVFDVVQEGYRNWGFIAPGLVFAVIGIGMLIHQWKSPAEDTRFTSRIFPYFFAGFSLIWTITTFWATYSEYSRLKEALLTGRYETVEGTITDFVPMPPGGHATEHFKVNGHYYSYSNYIVIAGFNKTQVSGGPLRGGMNVRIADVGGQIARLEIAEAEGTGETPAETADAGRTQTRAPFTRFFPLPLGWLAVVLLASVVYQAKKRKLPAIEPTEILYRESGASGSSHKNFLTRLGGARGCLIVTATKNEVDVRAMFPFNLLFLPEIYDLQHRIPVRQIRNIERVSHMIGRDSIRIDFLDTSEGPKTIELYLGNLEKFLHAIGWNGKSHGV